MKLRKNKTQFWPYGMHYRLPMMGKVKVMLKCEAGAKSTVYVLKNQQESLLGRIDCEALGIIVVKSGGNPGNLEQVGRLSTIQLQCERQENQEEIDDKMTKLLEEFPQLFD